MLRIPGSRIRAISSCLLAVLSLTAQVGCGQGDAGATGPQKLPPLPVHTIDVAVIDLPRTISSVGSLESPEMTTVASEIAGTVVALSATDGEQVESGHIILKLDDTEARATLKVAQARLENARDRLARARRLFKNGVASQQQLDDATSNHDAAEGAHRAADTRLSKHVLRAPYDGMLGLGQVDLGGYVGRGDPIVEISDTTALELRFALPQRFIGDLTREQSVLGVVGRCGPRFEGRVVAIDPRVDPRTRMVGVRAAIPNEAGDLHPGMAVRLRVIVGSHEGALFVPQETIVRQGTKHVVYVVDEESRAHPRNVSVGEYFLDGVHVTTGLDAGDQVVVAGHQKLRPGSVVVPSPDAKEEFHNPVVDVGRYGPVGCEAS